MATEKAPQDALPSAETLKACADVIVLDKEGKEVAFKTLVHGDGTKTKHLVIWIRHFFCGACQSYISTLSEELPPSALPSDVAITIIGCGKPDLVAQYVKDTGCAYPIYCDPAGKLYKLLGMTSTLAGGSSSPAYLKNGVLMTTLLSVKQIVTNPGAIGKTGSFTQVGGEFLFERGHGEEGPLGGWNVSWCHRMQTTRDHTEVPDVRAKLVAGDGGAVPATGEAKVEHTPISLPGESGAVA